VGDEQKLGYEEMLARSREAFDEVPDFTVAVEEELAVAEPQPAEALPAETAEQAAPPEKPARKRRSKKAAEEEQVPAAAPEAAPVPVANNDSTEDQGGELRRGWWQRTFG